MGTWIAHLRIADNLLSRIPDLEEMNFVYGNLAPDSGMPNENWTVFDPPKEITHFSRPNEGEGEIRDLEYYRKHLLPVLPPSDRGEYSFRLGYFFHLLCDILWFRKIGTTTIRAFDREIRTDPGAAWETIKADWYGQDFLFVRRHPDGIFQRVLAATPNPPSRLPFIPDHAFHHQMDYIRGLYGNIKPEWIVPRPYPYLNERTMNRFVDESTAVIDSVWRKRDRLSSENGNSALDRIDGGDLLPYAMPLGDPAETPDPD
jgi:hypothetical protein